MKSGFWCEIVVPSILFSMWIPPVYAGCVQCLPTEQNPAPAVTTANQLVPISVTLSSSSLGGMQMPGLQAPDRTIPQAIQPVAYSATTIQFVPSTTDLARQLASPSPIAAPVLILPERPIGQGERLLASRTRSQPRSHHRGTNPEPSPSQTLLVQTVLVTDVVVTGNTAISDAEIAVITSKLLGKSVDFTALQAVADEITQVYLDRGYITSRAILPEQAIVGGVVPIQVIEGGLERIDIEGNQRVSADYIRGRVALGGTVPLRQDRLEDQLRLLRSDPLFENVEASLKAGEGQGKSILTVRVTEASPFFANLSADNFSPPSVGSEKLGIGLGFRNLTGAGDQITGAYSFSTTSGSSLFDFSYRYPLNPMNGTVQVRVAPSSYRITDPTFAAFGIRGNTDLYDITFRQPLVRSPREEFALSLGFTYQRGQTFLFNNLPQPFGVGPDASGVSTTSVLKFGQDYVSRDAQGAWALRSQFNVGLGIFGATSNPDPIPDGSFFSWLLQGQRVQLLSPDQLLIIQADLQLAANTLLPSQQFVIGGGQSVRGFRQNVRSGDNGFRLSVENRITIQRDESGAALVQLAPFLDMGAVWNTDGNPNTLQSQLFLAAIGLGFLWEPLPRLNIRLDYAIPFVNLNDRGINVQDSAFYFSVNYGI